MANHHAAGQHFHLLPPQSSWTPKVWWRRHIGRLFLMSLLVSLTSRLPLIRLRILLLILARSLFRLLRRRCGLSGRVFDLLRVVVLLLRQSDCRRADSRALNWSWRGVRHLHNVTIPPLQGVESKHT